MCLLLLGSSACSSENLDSSKPDFQAYWSDFRAAALANDSEKIVTLTRFPFLEKGIVPGIDTVSHSRESFLGLWDKLMEMDSGNGSSNMRQMIETTTTVRQEDLTSDHTAQVGMFEFEETGGGWFFTGAFLSE